MEESRETRPREKITLDTFIPPLPTKSERLAQLDEDRYTRDIKIIEGKISKLRDKKKGVHEQIKVKKEGGKMDNQDFSVKEFIGTKVASRKELLGARGKLREELETLRHDFFAMIDEQKKIRPKIKIFDKEKTEKQIENVQRKIETTTLTLAEEKKCIAELSELQISLPLIGIHAARAKKIDNNKARQEVIKGQLAEINSQIDQTSLVIEETNTKIKNSKEEVKNELPGMFQESKKIQAEIEELELQKKSVYDDLKEKKSAYQKQQNEIKQIEWMTKMKTRLIEQEERRKENEEYEKQKELNKPHPYAKEILSCDTYISYLSQFIPKENPASSLQTTEKKAPEVEYLPEKALLNAKETEEWFGAGAKKQKKKKAKKQKVSEGLLTNQPIDLLNFFSYCGLKVPTNVEEAKKSVEVLEEKRKQWIAMDTRDNKDDSAKKNDSNHEVKHADVSFDPVNFPAPEESKEKEEYGIFKDSGPVPVVLETSRGKRGKRRFK